MAKNWNMGELVDAIVANDIAGIQDVGRRFPVATTLMAKVVNGDRDAIAMLMHAMPDHLTVRKINSALTDGVEEDAEDENDTEEEVVEEKPKSKRGRKQAKTEDEDEEVEEKPAKKTKKVAKDDASDTGYEGKTARELFELCNERGLKAEPKKPTSYYIALLEDADKNGSKKEESEEDDDWDI